MLLKWRKADVRHSEPPAPRQLSIELRDENQEEKISPPVSEATVIPEDNFRLLFNANPLPMVVFDAETFEILEVNDAAVRSYGHARADFLRMTMIDLRSVNEAQRFLEIVTLASSTDGGGDPEDTFQEARQWRHWRVDGGFVDLEVIGQAIQFSGRNAVLVIAREVTNSKRTETEHLRLSTAMQQSSTGIFLCDLDGVVTDVNGALVRAYGAGERSEIIGQNAFSLLAPEERNRARNELSRVSQNEPVLGQVYLARTRTGTRVPVEISLALMTNTDEQPVGFVCMVNDVSKWKRAEQMLREREELFRQLPEYIDAVFWVIVPQGMELLYLSSAYERIWGRPCASAYEQPWSLVDAIHPEDRGRVFLALQQCADGDEDEYRIVRPDGSLRWVRGRQFVVRDDNGEPWRLVGMVEDITERQQEAEQLRYNEEQIRELTEYIKETFWIVTADGTKVLYVSSAYEEMWGRKRSTVYEQSWALADGIHPEDCDRVLPVMLENVATDGYDEEYRVVHPNGAIVWIHDRAFPVLNDNGEVLRVVRVSADVTLQKTAQEAKEDLSRQLIEAQEAERRHFARELHDEIGQMLTALKINLEAVLPEVSQKSESRLVDSINMVHGALQQVRNLCLDLRPSQLDDLGLAATLEWYVDRQAERTGLNIHLMINPFPRPDPVVETTCFRVVQEALTNIVRHAKARQVWIELRQQKSLLELVLYDDGLGFDVEQARKRAVEGTSGGILGMEERVRLVKGTIEMVARPNRGVLIRASFPLVAENDEKRSDEWSSATPPIPRSKSETKPKLQTKRTGISW
ncbi:MAG: PAS domain S-box protein [Candidatus Binatia bacterium]